ncbi:MAG: nuclear transport factor 2 family protein, partial [Flavisolibacter sp.]|nr:nuclear transport factor 2 family protein [Flavisolibacter sp.]
MKLTKKIEKEIKDLMNDYWDSYLNGNIEHWGKYLVDDYRNIGGTEEEIWNSKKEILDYTFGIQDQMIGLVEVRNKTVQIIPYDPYFMVHELSDMYVKVDTDWSFYGKFRLSSLIQKIDAEWKVLHQHGSFPDSKTTEGEAWSVDAMKSENKKLRKAVQQRTIELEEKNRELEIETSLEKVRGIAMGMQLPDDMLGVCKVLYHELKSLGFEELRNAMIHSFPEGKEYFINYDYTANAGGQIAHIPRSGNPLMEKFVKEIRKSADAFQHLEIKGKALKDWIAFRKANNEAYDPRLNKTTSLNYYNYAVGPAGIGISTYGPIDKEKQELLQRFRNVFQLAYQRYSDISLAEAQAREAQIEVSLERVRSRAMAMHKTDELLDAGELVYKELTGLGITSMAVSYAFVNEEEKNALYYGINPVDGKIPPIPFVFPHTETEVMRSILSSWKKQESFAVIELDEQATIKHQTWVGEHIQTTFEKNKIPFSVEAFLAVSPQTAVIYTFHFTQGYIFIIGEERLSAMQEEMVLRFTKVFEMTYRRFLDLQKAEAQTREAQIELVLERVRAKTMAMQKSDELPEAANLLFLQVQALGMPAWSAGYCIWEENKKAITLWMSSEGVLQPPARAPLTEDPSFIHMREAYERGESFFVEEIGGDELVTHYKYMRTLPVVGEILDSIIEAGHPLPTFQIFHLAYFSQGFLLFITYEPVPDAHEIFKRFGKVFDQTYTRFLDLQKAEASAREAQINLAVERVRAKALAMYKSEEILDVVFKLKEEVMNLNIPNVAAATIHLIEKNGLHRMWDISSIEAIEGKLHLPLDISFRLEETDPDLFIRRVWTDTEKYFLITQDEKDFKRTIQWLRDNGRTKEADESDEFIKATQLKKLYHPTIQLNNGRMCIDLLEAPSDEIESILTKMGDAFDLAYKRFEDLKNSEAQLREAQIEAALEKVRSSSLAMHKSDHLKDVVITILDQLQYLGFAMEGGAAHIGIFRDASKDFIQWSADTSLKSVTSYKIPYNDNPCFADFHMAKKAGKDFFFKKYSFEEKNTWFDWAFVHTDFKYLPDEFKKHLLESDSYANWAAFQKNSAILVGNVLNKSLSPDQIEILKRFSKVFEQSYIRFLDLQKAEASAREAEIELALERVRSQAMAMQKSSDLLDIVVIMRNEFTRLGHEAQYFWHMMWLPDKYEKAMTSGDGTRIGMVMELPRHIHGDIPLLARWENSAEPTVVHAMGADAAVDYIEKMITLGNFQQVDHNAPTMDDIRHIGGLTFIMARTTHGEIGYSLPGVVENPPNEDLDILVRFAGAFDIAHRRFLDLKKSEAQAREVQIELALEKVRSRSMGMQKSEELKEVIQVVYDQFIQLSMYIEHTGFIIDYKERDDMHIWLADQHEVPTEVTLPYFDCAHWNSFIEAKEKGNDFFANLLEYEEKNKFYRDLFELIPGVPEEALEYYFKAPGLAISTVLLDNVGLYIENFSGTPYTQEENNILMRFGKVFQQTYTRFLDLQKAEESAREAMIEGALEKVRSRSLAMHKSDELGDVITIVIKKLHDLNFYVKDGVALITFTVGSKDLIEWMANPGFASAMNIHLPYFDHPILANLWNAKDKGEDFFVKRYDANENKSFLDQIFEFTEFKHTPQEIKDYCLAADTYATSIAFQKNTAIFINDYSGLSLSEQEIGILKRFAKVFEQAYIRFLDLQKAEAQAREGQIELGLERVRARAMAMQQSDELKGVIGTVYAELTKLNISLDRCLIWIMDSEDLSTKLWMANAGSSPVGFYVPYHENPPYLAFLKGWKEKNTKWKYDLGGKIKKDWDEFVFSKTEMKHLPGPVKKGMQASEQIIMAGSFQKFGCLQTAGPVPLTDEQYEVLNRFAKVFDSTYTRFNDLLKAEAQAREAQIEASLEKVRSRTMAMQRSDELLDVATVLFQQVKALGVPQWNCGFNIWDIGDKDFTYFPGSPDGLISPSPCKIPLTDHPVFKRFDASRKRGEELLVYEKEGEEQTDHYQYMLSLPGVGDLLKSMLEAGFQFPPFQIDHLANFAYGNLLFITYEHFPEMHDVFKRFARVFEQTYTRFLDLKKAEAQARESHIEVALERVRSRSLAMHKSEELRDVIQVIHNQLVQLGLEISNSGIMLDYRANDDFNLWMADSYEEFPVKILIPYVDHPQFNSYKEAKKRGLEL